ncbi:MAG: CHAP domain-containing protein [Clostridia bacterium]|nr:CHAP domain-containing protein [Clostridia bacterium]
MNYQEFTSYYNGKSLDYDGVAGVQCVDLVKFYLNKVFGLNPGAWGNAKDYYENFNNISALKNNFTRIANTPSFVPQKGDIVVWGAGLGNTYGHIAIATGEGNTSQFYSYDMNWGGKACKKVLHNYKGFLGVLRPKDQSKITGSSLFWVRVDKAKACVRNQPNSKTGTLVGSRYLYKGNTFQASGTVVGENVSGNNIWYKSWKGNYVWSGGLTRI